MNRINLVTFFGILILNSFLGFGQKDLTVASISDCSGAIQMEANVILNPKLLGNSGVENVLKAYSDELELPKTNSLWFKFESPYSGWLRFSLEKFDFPLEYGVFILNEGESCAEISDGKIKLYAHQLLKKNQASVSIDSIQYSKNQVVLLFVNTTVPDNKQISVQAQFKEDVDEKEYNSMKKVFDLRTSTLEEPFSVMIRDAKTKLPIVANVIVSDSKTHNALYTASDIVFPYSDNLKMTLKIDVSGYFFQDVLVNSRIDSEKEQYVFLVGLEQNQLIELEGLVFQPQTDLLLPEAMPKLKRLKDFMLINTEINIEIQGHVHLDGTNSSKAKRLSKKRAKSVKKSLVEDGINKKRITVVGYGNSKMKYPNAETDAEKQANRRVEIKIK